MTDLLCVLCLRLCEFITHSDLIAKTIINNCAMILKAAYRMRDCDRGNKSLQLPPVRHVRMDSSGSLHHQTFTLDLCVQVLSNVSPQ